MKTSIKLIKLYLNFLSVISPKYAGKIAVTIFQKVRLKKIKKRESSFYTQAKNFIVKREHAEDLHCYEFGNPNGKLVFLIHGWNSNAGSLSKFTLKLASENYRVISFDLPAHAKNKEKHTNLYVCKEAFKILLNYINPVVKFSVIGHSFGAAVIAYALANSSYKIDKIVLLSANNKLEEIFRDYQKMIGFNNIVFNQIKIWTKKIIQEDLETMIISNKLKKVNFDALLVIHDKFDKVIPYHNAEAIANSIPNAQLIKFEKIGHYRMLWNETVLKETINFIK